jgi:hypothetical protein
MNPILNGKSNQKFICDVKNGGNNIKNIIKDRKTHIELEKPEPVNPKDQILNKDINKNEQYYLSHENALTFAKYGRSLFKLNKEYEPKFLIPSNYLERHSLTPEAREKMVDWMIEVFSVNNSEPGTLELAVHIMDTYILNTEKTLKNSDIHLIGLCSIYIASKVVEKIPLRLTHIVKNLGKNTFSKNEITEKEKDIVKTIEFDFFTAGTYDYLMVFFYDLKVNNSAILKKLGGNDIVNKLMKFCVFLSKLTLYNHEFVTYRTSLVALAVLSLGYDFLKINNQIDNDDVKYFLRDWIYYLINEMKYVPEAIKYVYEKIHELYRYDIYIPQLGSEGSYGILGDKVTNLFKLYQEDLL